MWDGRRRRWTGPITGGNQKDGLAFAFVRDSIGTEAVQTVNQPMPNGARVPGYAESKQTGSTDDDRECVWWIDKPGPVTCIFCTRAVCNSLTKRRGRTIQSNSDDMPNDDKGRDT